MNRGEDATMSLSTDENHKQPAGIKLNMFVINRRAGRTSTEEVCSLR